MQRGLGYKIDELSVSLSDKLTNKMKPKNNMAEVVIRECHGLDDFEACLEIQKRVWGHDEAGFIPSDMFIVAKKIGGQVIGSFDGERMVGFALALPGYRDRQPYFHSHMLAVDSEYRNLGLGRRMKLAQREDMLRRGIRLMEWTFDPLEIKNAHLNFERLGVIVRNYIPNLYGSVSSALQGGLPTDRLIAEWWIESSRVRRLLDQNGAKVHANEITTHVTVPGQVYEWKAGGDPRARETQTRVRETLIPLLQDGLAILQHRILNDGSGEFGLGRWDEERSCGGNGNH
jgi:predicted GNAT superfamily acetyltransferase